MNAPRHLNVLTPAPGAPPRRSIKRSVLTILLRLKKSVRDRRLARYRRSARRPLFGPRVLVVSNDGIGNAVEATPLLQAVKMLWPRAHVTFLAPQGDLFADWNLLDRITSDVAELAGLTFDHTFMTQAYKLPASGLPCTTGTVHRMRRLLSAWQTKPERQQCVDMIRPLGFRGATPPLYVSLCPPDAHLPPTDGQRICLVPGGKPDDIWRHKRWPYYDALARRLLERDAAGQLVIIGGPQDALPETFPVGERIFDLRGKLSLRQVAWVLKHATLAIGNDCGPMHIADAVQTPGIVLFGMTCELKNGPMYRAVPMNVDVACSPCQYQAEIRDACCDPVCMTGLTVDLVLDQVDRILAQIAENAYAAHIRKNDHAKSH